jgi:hypothetical protein
VVAASAARESKEATMAQITVPTAGRPTTQLDSADVLIGIDGNAFVIMGTVKAALRRAGASPDYISAYISAATSGDYDNVLATSMAYLDADVTEDPLVEALS